MEPYDHGRDQQAHHSVSPAQPFFETLVLGCWFLFGGVLNANDGLTNNDCTDITTTTQRSSSCSWSTVSKGHCQSTQVTFCLLLSPHRSSQPIVVLFHRSNPTSFRSLTFFWGQAHPFRSARCKSSLRRSSLACNFFTPLGSSTTT